MTESSMEDLRRQLAETRAEYEDEEREAIEEEIHEYRTGRHELWLSPEEQEVVHRVAARAHVGPRAILHQWVTERVERETDTSGELGEALEAAARNLERAKRLARQAG